MKNKTDSNKTQLAAACILFSVADADEILEDQELTTIGDILQEFFSIYESSVESLMQQAQEEWKKSASLFQFGTQLNQYFSHDDKLDFISCVFEVAYADGNLHYLEHHAVKKIANILHLEKDDLISAKAEIENYLD